MCLILFAHNTHPDYPLIMAANRDEFYARPTQPAHFWAEHPCLLAGRDLQAGGTWLGITHAGRLAAITNYREGETSPASHSRGQLTLNYLLSDRSAPDYLRDIDDHGEGYNGFNLLIGEPGKLHYYGNRAGPPRSLDSGIYALGNGFLWDNWEKMTRGKADFRRSIEKGIEPEHLLAMMTDSLRAEDRQLPDTGVDRELERLLSARFICGETYGTRATTVLLVDRGGQVIFLEQGFTRRGTDGAPARFDFSLSGWSGGGF